jgi:shikimate dehydrogenase
MKIFGLIGFPLSHSFSQKYFSDKFSKEKIPDVIYRNFEIKHIDDLPALLDSYPDLHGLNVTIPYKEEVRKYIDSLDHSAEKIGAVNVIKILPDGNKIGFNSDYYGFRTSLETWTSNNISGLRALVLGTGGAAKAVRIVLDDCNIPYSTVSRNIAKADYDYYELTENSQIITDHKLIINTTPLGMYPNVNEAPHLPYELLNEKFYLYDLIYNPALTLFLKKGRESGARIKNGLEMLELQAEKSWDIWNE